ncbi:MAG TPA: sigma factor-like helix-turn-helix DNA-binding protein, partial [Solirubrobacteraceae bacterium]|nr:sigma factor-like helix-turn-helix DNA-binding protein [Solirubrobacteraceae bacterium]
MDEVRRLCVRLLGEPAGAAAAQEAVRAAAGRDRADQLRAALVACRQTPPATAEALDRGGGAGQAAAGTDTSGRRRLADAIAGELRHAVAGLELGEREALALRDLLGLSYEEIAAVTDSDPERVALLLAAARLGVRERLRGPGQPQPECPERERALRTIAARQDEQPVPAADDDWLIDHLGHCGGCAQAHAAMLEAAACYRA